MWIACLILLLSPHLSESLILSTEPEAISTRNDSLSEVLPEDPVGSQKPVGGMRSKDGCSIPCELAAKLIREEKHSLCGHLQQSLLSYGRSTRKLIRDVMEEQHRALEFLSSQVAELMTKLQNLSSEVQRSNNEMYSVKPVQSHGRDCSDIRDSLLGVVPKIPSGIYIIHPDNSDSAFEVFCEMDYMGGGWTVMQRRIDGMTDFKRPWASYVDGFGHLPGEHWLGLRKVFNIVNQRETRFQLHVALVSHDDITSYASYDDFSLGNETQFYSINLGRYAGSAGDAFRGYDQDQNQDTAPFSASDVDNDGCLPFCSLGGQNVESCSARHNQTGWWFNQCGQANLNGSPLEVEQGGGSHNTQHILWDTWTLSGVPRAIKSVTMTIRRIATNN